MPKEPKEIRIILYNDDELVYPKEDFSLQFIQPISAFMKLKQFAQFLKYLEENKL